MEKEKTIWMTSRELAIAAALGSLNFAASAMGLVVPVLPAVAWDIGSAVQPIGAMASGPIGGIIIAILASIPRPVAVLNLCSYIPMCILYALCYYPIRNLKNRYRMPLMGLVIFLLNMLYLLPIGVWFVVYFYKMAPPEAFWPLIMTFVVPVLLDAIARIAVALAVLAVTPGFVQPTWWSRWRHKG